MYIYMLILCILAYQPISFMFKSSFIYCISSHIMTVLPHPFVYTYIMYYCTHSFTHALYITSFYFPSQYAILHLFISALVLCRMVPTILFRLVDMHGTYINEIPLPLQFLIQHGTIVFIHFTRIYTAVGLWFRNFFARSILFLF